MKAGFSRGRFGAALVAAAALVTAVLVVGVLPGQALTPSKFEIDGNLVVNTSGNGDWCTDFPAPVSPTGCTTKAPDFVGVDDTPTGQNDDSFGNGTAEDTPVPSVTAGGIPNNKSDLSRFYVSHESVGGQAFLYLAWERNNTIGTANMDFEFNKSKTLTSNGKTPVRTAGDILITYDFAGGGKQVGLGLLKWVNTGATSQCEAASKLPCWGNRVDLSAAGEASGAVNDGVTAYDPIQKQTLADKEFGEAAINLTQALNLGANDCTGFASAYLKSRASTSFNSEMKDFIAPKDVNLSLCQPATVKVKKVDSRDTTQGLPGAVFELYNNDGTDATALDAGDHLLRTCTTDATGNCTFSPDVTGEGTISMLVHEKTPPAGFTGTADQIFSVNFTTTAQTFTRTFQDSPVPGTINIHKQDDSGNALAGAEFTLYTDSSPFGPPDGAGPNQDSHGVEDTATSMKCTTSASGDCSLTSVPLGKYWVVETKTPAGYSTAGDKYANITLGSQPSQGTTVSLTLVDPVVKGTINVHKQDDSGGALQGAEFTLYTDSSPFGPPDGAGANQDSHGAEDTATSMKCTTNSSGDCTISNVPIGKYWVVETATPAGYSTAGDKYANIALGSQAGQGTTISLTFVNPVVKGTVNVHKQDDSGNALQGAEFTLYTDNAPLGPADGVGPNQDTHGVEDVATALKCTTNSAGNCTISNVPLGKYWVVETATPAGYSTAGDKYASIILGSQANQGTTVSLTFVDPVVPGTINIHKQDDSGNPLAGAEFTLYTDSAPLGPADGAGPNQDSHGGEDTATAQKCTTGSSGDCTISNVPIGKYWVVETVTPAGYSTAGDKYADIVLGSLPNQGSTVSLTFVDPVVKGTINVHKQDDLGNALEGAEFTLYTDASPLGPPDGAGSNQDSHGGEDTATSQKCTTDSSGDCTISNVPIGKYWVVETVTPNGYATADDKYANVAVAGQANQGTTINLTFVDPRQHKVIVIVCHQGTNTLDQSSVTIDGVTKQSLSTAPSTITEDSLCRLGGAQFGGLGHGSHSGTVDIPSH